MKGKKQDYKIDFGVFKLIWVSSGILVSQSSVATHLNLYMIQLMSKFIEKQFELQFVEKKNKLKWS